MPSNFIPPKEDITSNGYKKKNDKVNKLFIDFIDRSLKSKCYDFDYKNLINALTYDFNQSIYRPYGLEIKDCLVNIKDYLSDLRRKSSNLSGSINSMIILGELSEESFKKCLDYRGTVPYCNLFNKNNQDNKLINLYNSGDGGVFFNLLPWSHKKKFSGLPIELSFSRDIPRQDENKLFAINDSGEFVIKHQGVGKSYVITGGYNSNEDLSKIRSILTKRINGDKSIVDDEIIPHLFDISENEILSFRNSVSEYKEKTSELKNNCTFRSNSNGTVVTTSMTREGLTERLIREFGNPGRIPRLEAIPLDMDMVVEEEEEDPINDDGEIEIDW